MTLIKYIKQTVVSQIEEITAKQERETGLVLILLCLIVSFIYFSVIWTKVALVVTLITLLWPRALFPIAVLWFSLASLLGHVTSAVLLTVLFILLVVPIGLLRKMLKKDGLQLRSFKKNTKSAFVHRDHLFEAADLQHPF